MGEESNNTTTTLGSGGYRGLVSPRRSSDFAQNEKTRMTHPRKFLTPAQKQRLAAEQKYCCRECEQLLPSTWQVDHRVPLHLGGTNDWLNLQILCPLCHANKSQLEAIEREALTRQRKNGQISPYFPVLPAVPDRPPPFVLRRRCRAPTITFSYSDP